MFCVWGALKGPREGETFSILDLYCQNLRRVLFLSCLGALTGPGEFCQSFYCIMFRVMKYVPFVWCQIDSGAKLTPVPN